MALSSNIADTVRQIRAVCALEPRIAIVLGTGLNELAAKVDIEAEFTYADLVHFPDDSLHKGTLILGSIAGKACVVLTGRLHCYEGFSMQEVTYPVRVARALGAESLIVSNAAGGMNPNFDPGDIMLITDHINMMGDNPLIGRNDDCLGPRFPDMSDPYTAELQQLAETSALQLGIKLQKGVYLGCAGPSLETRAEYRFMRLIGADAVGMSTVPEVIVAVHAGLKVLGFSVITDTCLPDALEPVDIDKIIATANAAEPDLSAIVWKCIENL